MLDLIERHRAEITALCERLQVRRLWVFGSALRGDFDASRSDIDILVDLGTDHPRPARQFHELREALEKAFGRPVDLTSVDGVRNPLMRAELEATRQPIYVAA